MKNKLIEQAQQTLWSRDFLGYSFEMGNIEVLKKHRLYKYVKYRNPKKPHSWKRRLFPYTRQMLTNMSNEDAAEVWNIVDTFLDGIEDFKVEGQLFGNEYPKPRTMWLLKGLPEIEKVVKKHPAPMKDRLTAFMNLPLWLCSYHFCPHISAEKAMIRDYYLKFLGKRNWEEILEVFASLKFGDIGRTVKTVSRLLQHFFNFHVDTRKIAKRDLEHVIRQQHGFDKNFRLPDFWEKEHYSHYVIKV